MRDLRGAHGDHPLRHWDRTCARCRRDALVQTAGVYALRLLAACAIGLLAALVFARPAQAQLRTPDGRLNTACAAEPRVPPLPVPPKVIPTQADMPQQLGGQGTRAVITVNTKGVAAGWWVARTDKVDLYLYAVTWPYLLSNPDLLARVAALGVAPGGSSATAAAIGANSEPTLSILDMCDVWGPLAADLNASYPPPLPPAGTWRAVGGTIFRHAGGKLTGVVSGKTAAKDAPCSGLTVARAGTFVYQELVGGVAGEATRCVQP